MATHIHPTAIIEPGARLADGVRIGAYAYVGGEVELGTGTVLHHHACVEGLTQLGRDNEVFPFALIGSKTHDLKYQGGRAGLRAGDRNVFREYVTVHVATNDGEFTVLGSDNVILAYSHVAHDCIVGSHLVMSSHAALAGHVVVGDHVGIGWNAGVHQFCRLGANSMIGACAKVVQDVPPFMIADGNPASVRTINKVGLERRGFTSADIETARAVYKTLYRAGLNRSQAAEHLRAQPQAAHALVAATLEFMAQKSQRGLAGGTREMAEITPKTAVWPTAARPVLPEAAPVAKRRAEQPVAAPRKRQAKMAAAPRKPRAKAVAAQKKRRAKPRQGT